MSKDKRLERQRKLLEILLNGDVISGRSLAETLKVNVRTVYRDVEDLLQNRIPIEGATGPDGGYRLGPGSGLTPSLLASGEAFKQFLVSPLGGIQADVAGRENESEANETANSPFRNLVTKGRVHLDWTGRGVANNDGSIFEVLDSAITSSHAVLISDTVIPTDGESVGEVFVPLGVVFADARWVLIARDLHGNVCEKDFCAIGDIREVNLSFILEEKFDVGEWWQKQNHQLCRTGYDVVLRGPRCAFMSALKSGKAVFSRVELLRDGEVRVYANMAGADVALALLFQWGEVIVVEQPAELVKEFSRRINAIRNLYCAESG